MNVKSGKGIDVITNLLKEHDKIVIENDTVEMRELRELEKKVNPENIKYKNVILFWDDIMQFTTLGLIDCILDYFDDIEDKEYDYDLFFYRGFENSNYIHFIINLFKTKFNKELNEKFILDFYEDNYAEILGRSPASAFFNTVVRCDRIFERILICYRYKFDGIEEFTKSLKKRFSGSKRVILEYDHLDRYDNDELKFLLKRGAEYHVIMIQLLSKALLYLEQAQKFHMSIVSPNGHNGVHENFFIEYTTMYGSSRYGPYNSEITIFNEGFYMC